MATHLWLITAKTNLHVGNENTSGTGVIDKAVQRDALTGLPCINASSLKGAINEYCTFHGMPDADRKKMFGSDKSGKNPGYQKGTAIFFDAKILYLPMQCDLVPYQLATRAEAVAEILDRAKLLGIEGVTESVLNAKVDCKFGYDVLDCVAFKELCDDEHLPVIARNKLDNGTSENLWYEQVIPAETVFCAMTTDPDDQLAEWLDGKYIQIGANATIGYGLCLFTKVL